MEKIATTVGLGKRYDTSNTERGNLPEFYILTGKMQSYFIC